MIFFNSPCSTKEAYFLIAAYGIRFNLSDKAKSELINLIHLLIPKDNKIPKTFKKLESLLVANSIDSIKILNYCSLCQSLLDSENSCQNVNCEKINNSIDTFYSVQIKKQLQLTIQKYYKQICHYITGKRKSLDFIDGSSYNYKNGTLNLMSYSDGLNITKSSKTNGSIWPVFLNLIELPPKLRDSKYSKIISGVWAGILKPNSDILFQYLDKEIYDLKTNGLTIL